MSTKEEIATYLSLASYICELALDELCRAGTVVKTDIEEITPVEGCFLGDPPKPRVTRSEVIAVVLQPGVLARWAQEGNLEGHIASIATTIRNESLKIRPRSEFRVYVLVYEKSPAADGEKKIHKLISLTLDSDSHTQDILLEFIERINLFRTLLRYYSIGTIRKAIKLGGQMKFRTDVVSLYDDFKKCMSYSVHYKKSIAVLIGAGAISLLTFIVSIIGVSLDIARHGSDTFFLALGFVSGIGLIAASEVARDLLNRIERPID